MSKKGKIIAQIISSVCVFSLFILGLFLIEKSAMKNDNSYEGKYINNVLDTNIPVVSEEKTMLNPYSDTNVKIISNYYNENDKFDSQTKSIINYGNTYMENTGIIYGNDNMFNVVAVLNGEVLSVEKEELLNISIQIKHSNDIISVYQCLSDSLVKVGDTVKQGQIIGNSGTTNITSLSSNQLFFELIKDGKVVNPNDYLNKEV